MNGPGPYERSARFGILIITLIVIVATCVGLLFWVLRSAAASGDSKELRNYLTKMATIIAGVLILSLVILFAVVIRYVAFRLAPPAAKRTPAPWESAWTEAGRRLKPEDAPPVPGFEDEPDREGDEEGRRPE